MKELTLWRYLSHEKWLLLLKDKGLFFSKASNFKDLKEGYYEMDERYSTLEEEYPDSIDIIDRARSIGKSIRDRTSEHTYISCWQNMASESMRMWEEYVCDQREGVLIKSSIPSLQLNKPKSLSEVISGASCKYYKNESENLNFRHPFEFKDNLYSFEQEYRLILDSMYMSTLTGFNPDNFGIAEIITENYESIPYHQTLPVRNASEDVQIKPGAGYVIKYPLEKIICEVRVHPLASDSYLSHVRQELINAGIDRPVNRSEITPERFSRSQRDEV